jgi:hypothetical protein
VPRIDHHLCRALIIGFYGAIVKQTSGKVFVSGTHGTTPESTYNRYNQKKVSCYAALHNVFVIPLLTATTTTRSMPP